MYYKLKDNVGLRKFKDCYAFTFRGCEEIFYITKEEYNFLKYECDGTIPFEDEEYNSISNENVMVFVSENVIEECECKPHPRRYWQVIECDNDYVAEIELAITQKCNMNCKYCFTTEDKNNLASQMTIEQIDSVLDQAVSCGVNLISLTGGEPLVHKDINEIIKHIAKRDLCIRDIMTNGLLITQDFLDLLKECDLSPFIMISFDGIGTHDSIRQSKSEKQVIKAIELCKKNGFRVVVSMNTNKYTVDSLYKTCKKVEKLGADRFRIIRTAPSLRWEDYNENGNDFTDKEWFDLSVDFLKWYSRDNHSMEIDFWRVYEIKDNNLSVLAIKSKNGEKKGLCDLIQCRSCITAEGNMTPCHQMSGILRQKGTKLGNVFEDGISKCLTDSKYHDWISTEDKERKKHNIECATCKYWEYCRGGCPLWGWGDRGRLPYGIDKSRCTFFKEDYYHKLLSVLPLNYTMR